VAAAAAAPATVGPAARNGQARPAGTWTVQVPGGTLIVTLTGTTSLLTGPAVIVAEGELDEAWLATLAGAATLATVGRADPARRPGRESGRTGTPQAVPPRAGSPLVGPSVFLSAEQAVELTVPGGGQERGKLGRRADQRGSGREARVADRDRAIGQLG
jgi:hypothetical protein